MESDTHNDTIRCDKATSSTLIYSSNQIVWSKSLARSGDMTGYERIWILIYTDLSLKVFAILYAQEHKCSGLAAQWKNDSMKRTGRRAAKERGISSGALKILQRSTWAWNTSCMKLGCIYCPLHRFLWHSILNLKLCHFAVPL